MNRDEIVRYLRDLDDQQWQQFVTEARGTDAAIRAAEQSGDWRQSMTLKNQQLAALIQNADENGHQK